MAPGPRRSDASKAAATSNSTSDQDELRALDDIFGRINKIIPDTPYILTVPSSHPFEHFSRYQAEVGWRMNGLFDRDEEHMQYMSFMYREHGESCFVCRTEVDEERDRRQKSGARKAAEPAKHTSSQAASVAKKKISLSDYKLGKASNTGGSNTSKKSSQNGVNAEATSNDTVKVKVQRPMEKARPTAQVGHKRLPSDSVNSKASGTGANNTPVREAKKPRLAAAASQPTAALPASRSQPPSATPEKSSISGSKSHTNSTPHGLPPPLSPIKILPPYGLPTILSPTLPPIIQAELDKLAPPHRRTTSSGSSTSEKRPSSTHEQEKSNLKSTSIDGTSKPSVDRGVDNAKPLSSIKAKLSHEPTPTSPRTLIVKFKFSKRNRSTMERILRLRRSTPSGSHEDKKGGARKTVPTEKPKELEKSKKIESTGRSKEGPSKESKITITKSGVNQTESRHSEKRPKLDDDSQSSVPSSKRLRGASDADIDKKPHTPISHTISSPALSNRSSAQKPQYLTPAKESRSTGMSRTLSGEGNDITPGFSGSTPSTSRERLGPTSAPGSRKFDAAQIWSEQSRKLNVLGRSLKHEAERVSKSNTQPTTEERRRAAVVSIECVLAYMAAYTSMDICCHQRGRNYDVDGNWKTLLPLWSSFRSRCQEFPHLEGFRLYLGAVICARMTNLVSLRVRQRPADSPQTDNAADLKIMADSFKDLQHISARARSRLPVLTIMSEYPKTWAKRCIDQEPKEWEQLAPGQLKGPYFLPLGVDTTPVQAVRMGIVFLQEWMSSAGLQYELQLSLS